MSILETQLAGAALAIALVAFITAFGQLLQQYFGTADGYRRCQRSVMGEWSTKTRLRWRWREFRFETLYTIPEIFMTSTMPDRVNQVVIAGGPESRVKTMVPGPGYSKHSHEPVCWITLLHQIHICTERLGFLDTDGISLPALIFRERSWDFQLPDIVLPLAICSVSDIAIIARRLGMRWKDFRPFDGSLKAEGHFQVMTSTTVRSLGIVMRYTYSWKEVWRHSYRFGVMKDLVFMKERKDIYMPTNAADCLGFGIIRGCHELLIPDISLGTQAEVVATLGILDESGTSATILRALHKANPDYHLPTGDLVAMTMVMARLRGRSHYQVPAPSENMYGFTTSNRGRRAFRSCLEKYFEENPSVFGSQTRSIVATCQTLRDRWIEWERKDVSQTSGFGNALPHRLNRSFADAIHEQHDLTSEWVTKNNPHVYRRLLGAHIRNAIFCEGGGPVVHASSSPEYEWDINSYFFAWPKILEDFQKDTFDADGTQNDDFRRRLFDTWVVMLFRACCWGAVHCFVPGERVPSQFYDSQIPVYIG